MHVWNPRTQEAEAEGSRVRGQPWTFVVATHCIPCLSQEAKQPKNKNNKNREANRIIKKTDNPIQKRADVLNSSLKKINTWL